MRNLIILIALCTVSFTFIFKKPKVLFGSYAVKGSVWHNVSLDLYSDSTFVAHDASCTYSYDGKGKWYLRKDTLIAIATQSRNERWDTIYKASEPETFLYLVRKKSVVCIEKDTNNVFFESRILVKKDPSKKPEVREKF